VKCVQHNRLRPGRGRAFHADDDTLIREIRALADPAATFRLNGRRMDVLGESHSVGHLGNDGRITGMAEIGRLIVAGYDPAEVR
jgi:hypothetical protein